jgi:hypothetical protein
MILPIEEQHYQQQKPQVRMPGILKAMKVSNWQPRILHTDEKVFQQ